MRANATDCISLLIQKFPRFWLSFSGTCVYHVVEFRQRFMYKICCFSWVTIFEVWKFGLFKHLAWKRHLTIFAKKSFFWKKVIYCYFIFHRKAYTYGRWSNIILLSLKKNIFGKNGNMIVLSQIFKKPKFSKFKNSDSQKTTNFVHKS